MNNTTRKIEKLPAEEITLLRIASCIENRFSIKLNLFSSITRYDILDRVMVVSFYSHKVRNAIQEPEFRENLDAVIQSGTDIQNLIEFTRHYQDLGTTAPAWQQIDLLLK